MTMKIDNSTYSSPLSTGGDGKARAPVAKPADNASSSVPSSTTVNLGSTSALFNSIDNGVMNTPSVNTAKVAEIKQGISEGRIQVNSSVISDSLIKSVTDLIAASH